MTNIAIDGPSGAGKSTIARMVSSELGMVYIDTGAMYRSLALKALRMGIDIKTQHDNVIALLEDTKVDLRHTEQGQRILLDGEDVSDFIRSPEVSVGASDIAVIPEVRVFLVKLQQEIAAHTDCIMDGRDIGTCVLPHAEVKIFLTASVEARARRRYDELIEKGQSVTYERVLEDMRWRDKNDSTRAASPLKQAEDAVLIDTTEDSLEEAIARVKQVITEKSRG